MSLPDLEMKIGLGNGTISRWKNASPNTDKLTKVADELRVSLDYLLGRSSFIENNTTTGDDEEKMREIAKRLMVLNLEPDALEKFIDAVEYMNKKN
jgi:transcriptional regulator with XRE-family HTH domain